MTSYLLNLYIGTAQKRRNDRIRGGRKWNNRKLHIFLKGETKFLAAFAEEAKLAAFFLRNISLDLVEPIFCDRTFEQTAEITVIA